jgi:hypothetical protein
VLLALGGFGALICCGCGGLTLFGFRAAGGVMDTQMVSRLNQDAVAQEHLGTVTSAKWDFMASTQATQKAGGKNIFVFHAAGDKGKADVHAEQAPGEKLFQNAKLILPDGNEVALGF